MRYTVWFREGSFIKDKQPENIPRVYFAIMCGRRN